MIDAVSPREWLRAVARIVLTGERDFLLRAWNVSADVLVVRDQLLGNGAPEDLRVALAVAQALVPAAVERGEARLLDFALIGAAQVIDLDVSSGRFAIVGMMIFLSPPLARAETFELLCETLRMAPCA